MAELPSADNSIETIDPRRTVAELALEHAAAAAVFRRHRIDYCCHGEVALAEACRERGLDLSVVTAELDAAVRRRPQSDEVDPRTLATAALIDHIVTRHHEYLREALPPLRPLAAKVERVHGAHNEKLFTVREVLEELAETLEPHLDEEEESLFPRMKSADRDDERIGRDLVAARDEHLQVGSLLEQLTDATDAFHVPEWACGSYRALFRELEALTADVLRHIHLENHVLMPRFPVKER